MSKYILWVDPDDILSSETIKKLNNIIDEKEYDYIEYNFNFLNTNHNAIHKRTHEWKLKKHFISFNECIDEDGNKEKCNMFFHTYKTGIIDRVLWTTCVKRSCILSILNKMEIDETDYCLYTEDNFIKMIITLTCNECLYIPDILYTYRRGDPNSITGTFVCKNLEEYKRKMTNTVMVKYFKILNNIYNDKTNKFIFDFNIDKYIIFFINALKDFSNILINNVSDFNLKDDMESYYNKNYKNILENILFVKEGTIG